MPKPSEYFTLRVIQFVILSCLPLGFWGQEDTAYVRTYGGPYFEEGRQIIECASGGYAVIGTTGSDVANNTNFYLLRLDASLECMWSKSLGGLEVEKGYSIVEDENENLFLCGYTNSEGAGGYDVLLKKTNSDGDELWRKTYGGEDWDFGYKIIKHPEGGFLICGKTYSMGNGGSDAYLLHVDDAGAIISEWTYGAEGDDEFVDVEIYSNVIIASGRYSNSQNDNFNGVIIKLDLGGLIEMTYFNEIYHSKIIDIVVKENKIYFCGNWVSEANFLSSSFGILGIDGTQVYLENVSFEGDFTFNSITLIDNDPILAGFTNAFGSGTNNGYFSHRASNGDYISGITIGAISLEFISALARPDGYILVGLATNEGFELPQVPVMLYPDYSFSSTSETIWIEESCFTATLNEIIVTDASSIKNLRIYSLNGQLIEEISMTDFQEKYEIYGLKSNAFISKEKKSNLSFFAIPQFD